jgi:K+-sensing histidine kinase KdpD
MVISSEFIDATPSAALLIESIRDIGYNIETAIADLVDNSISAGAKNVKILLINDDNNQPFFSVEDDGEGMTEEELLSAMRLGSKDPNDERRKDDLGRFGLGLKTASFSQCRQLTVESTKSGKSTSMTWILLKNEILGWSEKIIQESLILVRELFGKK